MEWSEKIQLGLLFGFALFKRRFEKVSINKFIIS